MVTTVVVAATVSAVAAASTLVVVAAVVVLVVTLLLVGLSVSAEAGSLELLAVHALLVSAVAVSLANVGLAVGVLVPHGGHSVHAHSLLHAGGRGDATGLAALLLSLLGTLLVLVVGGSTTGSGGGTVDAGASGKAGSTTGAGSGLGLLAERSAEAHAVGGTVHAHTSVGGGTVSLGDLLLGLSRGGLGLGLGSGRGGGSLGLGGEGGGVELALEVLNIDNALRGHGGHHTAKSGRRAGRRNAGGGGSLGLGNLGGEGLGSGRGGSLAGRSRIVATLGLSERAKGKVDALVLVTIVGVPLAKVENVGGLLLSGRGTRRSTGGRELGGGRDLGAGNGAGIGRTDDGRRLGNGRVGGRSPSGGIDVGASDRGRESYLLGRRSVGGRSDRGRGYRRHLLLGFLDGGFRSLGLDGILRSNGNGLGLRLGGIEDGGRTLGGPDIAPGRGLGNRGLGGGGTRRCGVVIGDNSHGRLLRFRGSGLSGCSRSRRGLGLGGGSSWSSRRLGSRGSRSRRSRRRSRLAPGSRTPRSAGYRGRTAILGLLRHHRGRGRGSSRGSRSRTRSSSSSSSPSSAATVVAASATSTSVAISGPSASTSTAAAAAASVVPAVATIAATVAVAAAAPSGGLRGRLVLLRLLLFHLPLGLDLLGLIPPLDDGGLDGVLVPLEGLYERVQILPLVLGTGISELMDGWINRGSSISFHAFIGHRQIKINCNSFCASWRSVDRTEEISFRDTENTIEKEVERTNTRVRHYDIRRLQTYGCICIASTMGPMPSIPKAWLQSIDLENDTK